MSEDSGFKDKGKVVWDSLLNDIAEMNHMEAVSGFTDAVASSPNGELSIAQYMTVNEYGSKDGRIPARPFMAQAFDKNEKKYHGIVNRSLPYLTAGRIKAKDVLLGLAIEGHNDIKREIIDGQFVPNAEATIQRKGSSRPLINFGLARAAVTFKIRRKGEGE